jgi:hypothetical protein
MVPFGSWYPMSATASASPMRASAAWALGQMVKAPPAGVSALARSMIRTDIPA